MTFDWLAFHTTPHLRFPLPVAGYVVTLVLAALTVTLLARNRRSLTRLTGRRLFGLLLLLGAAVTLAQSLVVHVQSLDGSAGALTLTLRQGLPLLGLLPVLLAALWLGRGSAILVGAATGLTWALFATGRMTHSFELAIFGDVLAALLNQTYQGRLARWLRQPLVAAPLAALLVAWPLGLISMFAMNRASALISLEQVSSVFLPSLMIDLAEAFIAALFLQVILARWPRWHPVSGKELQVPPWERHLGQRMLYTLAPLGVLAILGLVGVVAYTSYRVATQLVVEEMARDAASASSQVPFFIQIGRSLIRDLARDERLLTDDDQARQSRIEQDLRAVPFFQQLVYFDATGSARNAYPEGNLSAFTLSPEEASRLRLALENGIPTEVTLYGNETGQPTAMSFIAPVTDPGTSKPSGVLLGRSDLDRNPLLASTIDSLSGSLIGSGEGLVVDSQNRILLYPAKPERQQESFSMGAMAPISYGHMSGQAFRQREPDGTRQILYILPIEGRSDWSVVILVPNEVVLALAAQIAVPTLFVLVAMAILALPMAFAVLHRVTVPIEGLLAGVDRIAEGQLDQPVAVKGEDEIGRLGRAFEQMRIRLQERLNELERLLRISRSVSSSLELFRIMPPILSSALDMSHAVGVRVVLRRGKGEALQSYAAGEAASGMAVLDKPLLDLVERQGTVVISQLWRASASLDAAALPPNVKALAALPLRSDISFHGIIWLGYDEEHAFEQSELTFLSTLSGQAAIAVANTSLFAEVEEERRKLKAVLESTTDAMLVTDNEGRIVLMNPAAEDYFDLRSEHAQGHRAADVIDEPELAAMLTNLEEPVATLELAGRGGKTLLANTSTIVSQDGTVSGRVAVLRDITALKELDSIKTVFLRMVSHDLRSPLTYMRGYVSMLPLSGDLNERQKESVGKITNGIDHITELTERLTHLSRLQFGEDTELELALIDVEELVQLIYSEQEPLAKQKNITLKLETEERLPLIIADGILYRQAIANLINNALKYTPEGQEVIVRVLRNGDDRITVAVADTGLGIRQEDQPRLFEAFYRVPHREGEPPRPQGSGLGLALVKAIVEAHGGAFGVESEYGRGSTFHISLPVRGPEEV